MSKRCIVVMLGLGLFLAGSVTVMADTMPAATASTGQPMARRVGRVHQRLQDQKARTRQLRQQVDTLQKQQKADQKRLRKRDATITRLRKELKQLRQTTSPGH